MEKLIKLLNEYEAERHKTSVIADIRKGEDRLSYLEMNWNYSELLCISKGYEFIQRLVDNDKIDFSWEWKLSSDLVNLFERKLDNADWVIALLSISDTPIDDLISYLR